MQRTHTYGPRRQGVRVEEVGGGERAVEARSRGQTTPHLTFYLHADNKL